jgi:adenylylsulfate kinase
MTEKGTVIWFTGISGAGKSTLAKLLATAFAERDVRCQIIDGEDVREFFGNDLKFTRQERLINLKRIVYAAKLLSGQSVVTIIAAIAPSYEGRDFIRRHLETYLQIYVEVPLATAIERDTKGHYKNYSLGKVSHLVGVDDTYEVPRRPDLVIHSGRETISESLEKILNLLAEEGILEPLEPGEGCVSKIIAGTDVSAACVDTAGIAIGPREETT